MPVDTFTGVATVGAQPADDERLASYDAYLAKLNYSQAAHQDEISSNQAWIPGSPSSPAKLH